MAVEEELFLTITVVLFLTAILQMMETMSVKLLNYPPLWSAG